MKDESGFSLVEVLVSMAIMGMIGAIFLGAIGTATKTLVVTDERQTAKNLAETQMEYVKKQNYALSYSPASIPAEFIGYSATVGISSIIARDSNIQKITVTIRHQSKTVAKLEGYKVD